MLSIAWFYARYAVYQHPAVNVEYFISDLVLLLICGLE